MIKSTILDLPITDNIVFDKHYDFPYYRTGKEDIELLNSIYEKNFAETNKLNNATVYVRRESREVGILGEIVFKKMYPKASVPRDLSYDFDLPGLRVDVKCKFRAVAPKKDYMASFFEYQGSFKFNADVYYFMSATAKYDKVWLCGYISKDDILNHPHKEIWKKGETDKANGMTFRKNTICIPYMYLSLLAEDKVIV